MFPLDDTIAAVASAPGGAARGIVRLSGPGVTACLQTCFRADDGQSLARVRLPTAISGTLEMAGFASRLPCRLLLWPTARSYTRQPAAELHTVGSPPLLDAVLRQLCAAGARLAQPGEFTLRAFLAGRLDLTQAEAVLGVIDADGPRELQTALGQLAGGLAGPLQALRANLLDLLAHLEAGLDFIEEDIQFILPDQLQRELSAAAASVAALAERMTARSESGPAIRAVLVGSPNVGKSSLFNALLEHAAALVSPQAGTTRDYLCARLDLDGLVCELLDTAGFSQVLEAQPEVAWLSRAERPGIDAAAQEMAAQQQHQAHMELLCLDSTRPLNAWEQAELARHEPRRVLVLTKADRPSALAPLAGAIETSSHTGMGMERLRQRLREVALSARGCDAEVVPATAVRCRESLLAAAGCLQHARDVACDGGGEELVAAELRAALDQLGQVVGAVYTDDILDRVFSRFCIGK